MANRRLLADALKTFMFSLSQGIGAAGQAPGRQGTRLGMSAALGAPMQLQQMDQQRQAQQQDAQFRLQQFQELIRQRRFDEARQLFQAKSGLPGQELRVNAPVATPSPIGGLNGGPGFQPPPQGGGQQSIALPHAAIEGFGSPPTSQQIAIQKANELRQQAQLQQELAPPPKPDITPFGVESGLVDRSTGNILREPQLKPDTPTLIPGRDVPLPPDVEAQQMRMNANRAQQNGLSPQQFTRVQTLASQFDANPVVKNFSEISNQVSTVRQVLNRNLGGPGDLVLVYSFMKALDPTSVVRETEFEAASKSGNIFAGAFARFNGYLKPEGGFLPPQVKDAFFKILEDKLGTSAKQVGALYTDFGRRIDGITGQQGTGTGYLTDYASIYGGGPQTAPEGPTIRVVSPDGKSERDVPPNEVQYWISRGATVKGK